MGRRFVLPLVGAMLVALLAIRSAVGLSEPSSVLGGLRDMIPGHSAAGADRAMAAIGAAARFNRSPPASAQATLNDVAARAPFRTEPFLAAGAEALAAGDAARAERLFAAARARDPRSLAARYFLAELYLKSDRVEPALVEMAALTRLRPTMTAPLVPAMAAFARLPGSVPRLRAFFAREPEIRGNVLSTLASDARNAGLILSLAPQLPVSGEEYRTSWPSRLVGSLVDSGQLAAAERTWSIASGHSRRAPVNDGDFTNALLPAPFGWTLNSGTGGIAERAPGGGLSVISYGRERVELAWQQLNLAPGRYRLASTLQSGAAVDGISWTFSCLGKEDVAIAAVGTKGEFAVPAGCGGPRLKLVGLPVASPSSAEVRITSVDVAKVAP